jgi:hypothetical protein
MTNETSSSDKTFRMLIGDDAFASQRNAEDALFLMVMGMQKVTGRKAVEGRFTNGKIYVLPEFPLDGFDSAEVRVASSVEEMINAASRRYDLIATDMNYGQGYATGGKDVLRSQTVRQNPAVKAVFTSEDNPEILEELANLGAGIVVSPMLMKSKEDKATLLGRAIGHYYH